jgi:hypothetical protein
MAVDCGQDAGPARPKALPKPAGKLLHRPFLNRRFNLPNNHRPGGLVFDCRHPGKI